MPDPKLNRFGVHFISKAVRQSATSQQNAINQKPLERLYIFKLTRLILITDKIKTLGLQKLIFLSEIY